MGKRTAVDASPGNKFQKHPTLNIDDSTPSDMNPPYQNTYDDDDEKDHESVEAGCLEHRRLFPVHQFHSALYDPRAGLECDDEAFKRMEFIPVESLRA